MRIAISLVQLTVSSEWPRFKMPYPYQIFDVFSDVPLAGNPLAVVFDADDMDTARCQAIAKEFNLSETVFMMAPSDPSNTRRMRIFTPVDEMPFAGHPTVGGAVALARRLGGLDEVRLELVAGLTRCVIEDGGGRARIEAPKRPELLPGVVSDGDLGAILGLPEGAIGFGNARPTRATSGPTWTIAPVESPARLGEIRLDGGRLAELGEAFSNLYVIAPAGEGRFQCRMFAPLSGVPEDPATGSAAVAFAALFAAALADGDGDYRLDIAQGLEMGRPSSLGLDIEVAGGMAQRVFLSGAAVKVAEGELLV